MLAIARLVHLVAAWLFVAAVLVQGYLAGSALAQLGGSGDFGAHREFGYSVLFLLGLAVLISALLGRMPRPHVGLSFLLLVLYFVQTALPAARGSSPALAALHPALAMIILLVAVVVAWRATRGRTPAASA